MFTLSATIAMKSICEEQERCIRGEEPSRKRFHIGGAVRAVVVATEPAMQIWRLDYHSFVRRCESRAP